MGLRLFFLLLSGFAYAADYSPVRDTSLLNSPQAERMVEVTGARVVMADYDLLRRDFPHLQPLTPEEIDDWLLQEAAFVSKAQVAPNSANTPIAKGRKTREGLRPKSYGRAMVLPVKGGFLDVKGSGAISPKRGSYETGLASTGEAIREFIWEKAVKRVLDHAGSEVATVGNYAVIDFGFDVIQEDRAKLPAGIVIRQAHDRMPHGGQIDNRNAAELETLFRRYGFTSAGQYYEKSDYHVVNIQGTKNQKAIYDFGAFLSAERFEKQMKSLPTAELANPDGKHFPQPDPDRRIPYSFWGTSETGVKDPKYDNPWVYSHRLAQDFRDGKATREHAEIHLKNALQELEQRLRTNPAPAFCADQFRHLAGY